MASLPLGLTLLLGCVSEGGLRGADSGTADTSPPPVLPGPGIVLDDIHVAGFTEEAHAFSLLGGLLDPLLAGQIEAGTLLLGLELRDVEDPAIRNDSDLSVGLFLLQDSDGDPADNFDPEAPETFTLPPGSWSEDEPPPLEFVDGSLVGGMLSASGLGALDLLGESLPLPIRDLSLSGLVAAGRGRVRTLSEGRLRGALAASLLSIVPNVLGEACGGASLLDALATGCGLLPLQPDVDVDDDGLERFVDTDDDGIVDLCRDGDGTEIVGPDCPRDPAIADGYALIFVVHGVGAELRPAPDDPASAQ